MIFLWCFLEEKEKKKKKKNKKVNCDKGVVRESKPLVGPNDIRQHRKG